ncbi:protein transport protein Yif1p [Monosporozyma servazzii]
MSYNPYAYGQSDADTPAGSNGIQDRFQAHPNIQPHQQPQQQQVPQQVPQQGYMNQGQPPHGFMNQQQGGQSAFLDNGASMAFQIGSNAFNSFMGNSNFNQFQDTMSKAAGNSNDLSHYFQVSTSFVVWKLKQLLFPYLKTINNWQRVVIDSSTSANGGGAAPTNGTVGYATPRDDVNSPDMYIPLMGLITYILVWNIKQGLNGTFNPENLYYKLSSTLAFVGMDLFILKLGLYLLVSTPNMTNTSVTSLIELICFVGYKFVPLTMTLFAPSAPLWVNIALKTYLFITFGIFLLRSIKFNLFNTQDSMMINSIKKSTVKKCNYFLFVYGFLWQFVLMWLMA